MLEPIDDAVSKMTASVENELVVRDFLDNLRARDVEQLAPFLDADVVYQPSTCGRVHGRAEVLGVCRTIVDRFERFEFIPNRVAVSGPVVLLDQTLLIRFPGGADRTLMSFACFEVHDFQITSWRQLHG
ncbi:limonene-1,2-epoxide hydrolase family protein [Curtobacterium sp. VKM Ac-1376]|uniref:limonene-1,2-epoxide hydrolase family protein n=1 Tax=Curtobacterium sp. VKM Ac-1376 TaxID=123312 RepID=UPI00188A1267|nr:nuclear transport factor 2 family protein [Curtobacterium sp. VKM Ac-1376]MBF4613436.1 nuclear transport factor 2 family protein [Curtobacterium sp. VKM Ac-1376]